MPYYRRHWDDSRGDEYDAWGGCTYWFETDDGGYPQRQLEVYDRGPVLRYGPENPEDTYGFLSYARLEDVEDYAITHEEFERAWSSGPSR